MIDIGRFNRDAWDAQVAKGNRWTLPVDAATIAKARQGDWSLVLTPLKPVPSDWYPPLADCRTLCLASGGGQQGPILAAAGAAVTVYDNSAAQLAQDRAVAEREGLALETVQGDMRDLSVFDDESFDFIFHPCSNSFVPDILPVWREAYRVLRGGGTLISGMCGGVMFVFDHRRLQAGELSVRHALPYSDHESLTEQERRELFDADEPLCFGHTLEDQIGGQLQAGFRLEGFYEDRWGEEPYLVLDRIMPSFLATLARKPGSAP